MKKKSKRDRPIVVRVSKEEMELIKKESEKIGLSVSAFIRLAVHERIKDKEMK